MRRHGAAWVDVPAQARALQSPAANLNEVSFAPVVAQRIRVLVTPAPGRAVGIKELQVSDSARGYLLRGRL